MDRFSFGLVFDEEESQEDEAEEEEENGFVELLSVEPDEAGDPELETLPLLLGGTPFRTSFRTRHIQQTQIIFYWLTSIHASKY